MEGKELVVLRNEAMATLKSPLATEPAARDRKSLLPVFAVSALFSVAAMMWLHILTDTKTKQVASVQLVSIQAQTPPPDVEITRPFETMTVVDEPIQRPQQVAAAEPEPALPKFQAWAAQKNADVPTENAQPPKVTPATDAQPKASAAQEREREREQEALADKRWEERHARSLAAARRTVRGAPQGQQPPQQRQKPQQPQQSAPTASAAVPVVPQPSDSQRGGG